MSFETIVSQDDPRLFQTALAQGALPFPTGALDAVDKRSFAFLAADHVEEELTLDNVVRPYRYFTRSGPLLDQNKCHARKNKTISDPYGCGHCTGFALLNWARCYPVKNSLEMFSGSDLYFLNQDNDEWNEVPDSTGQEPYNGSSLNAAMKTGRQVGILQSWVWLRTVHEVISFMDKFNTPVMIATDWFYDMFFPERFNGYLKPTGRNAGGHMYVLNGYNIRSEEVRVLNSWGSWGQWRAGGKTRGLAGHARMTFSDLEIVLHTRQLPVAGALELKLS